MTRAGRVAEVVFWWACATALVVLALTSDTLAQLVTASGVCR